MSSCIPTTLLFDGNIYNRLDADGKTRERLAWHIAQGGIRVIATPVVVDELSNSPFGGLPDWFPIEVEVESVIVWGHWRWGMARWGKGAVYTQHRGDSKKIPDAIIADSADSLADILVSDDRRCRNRLADISTRCRALDYSEFQGWLRQIDFDSHDGSV